MRAARSVQFGGRAAAVDASFAPNSSSILRLGRPGIEAAVNGAKTHLVSARCRPSIANSSSTGIGPSVTRSILVQSPLPARTRESIVSFELSTGGSVKRNTLIGLIVSGIVGVTAPVHAQILGGGGNVGGPVTGSLSGGAAGSLQRPADPVASSRNGVDDTTGKARDKTDATATRSRAAADKAGKHASDSAKSSARTASDAGSKATAAEATSNGALSSTNSANVGSGKSNATTGGYTSSSASLSKGVQADKDVSTGGAMSTGSDSVAGQSSANSAASASRKSTSVNEDASSSGKLDANTPR
jgi:hypothetical protein